MLDFYHRATIVYNIMLLALILILNFNSPLSEQNAVGLRFQSHNEYKIIAVVSEVLHYHTEDPVVCFINGYGSYWIQAYQNYREADLLQTSS